MKTRLLAAGAAIATLALSSCLEMEQEISVKKDGSGTITEQVVLFPETVAQFEQMAAVSPDGKNPIDKMLDEETCKQEASKYGKAEFSGVKKARRDDGSVTITKTFKFQDINNVSLPATAAAPNPSAPAQPKPEPVTFSFKDNVLTVTNKNAASTLPPIDTTLKDEAALAQARQVFKGLKAKITLKFPDGLKSTTASLQDGNSVTLMSMNADEMLNPETIQKLELLQGKSAEEASKDYNSIKGLKLETKPKTTFELK